ncbi:SPBP35G2.12 [Scenedesmus sp. PABB004]|nr:SPBP35G2.12 [Scenedesmus sp. PABB004]
MATAAPPAAPEVLDVHDLTPPAAKWLRLRSLQCRDAQGRTYDWEFVERVSKFRETDGVGVFARVVAQGQPDRLLVIAQWRPPVRTFVLELPAGVIERGETPAQVAVRELREETGFTGAVTRVTPECTNDQGLCNSCLNFAFATVDAAAPENADPKPQLERLSHRRQARASSSGMADAGATAAPTPVPDPLAADPLPTAEQLAAAAAAAAAQKASSLAGEPGGVKSLGLGKGLGGAGLGPKRKGKPGGSTISSATAPAALAVRGGAGRSGGAGAPGLSRAGAAAGAAGAPPPPAAAGSSAAAAARPAAPGERALAKGGGGLSPGSFNLRMSRDTLDEDEWESTSTDEREASAAAAAAAPPPPPQGWALSEVFDTDALLLCGGVLAAMAGALLVLGGAAYLKGRR